LSDSREVNIQGTRHYQGGPGDEDILSDIVGSPEYVGKFS
jgi:hypothetical protein